MAHSIAERLAQPASGVGSWLASPAFVAGSIGLWLLAHAGLRLAFGPVLGMDDAEQTLYAQAWSWGYRPEQPPLFTWCLVAMQSVLPPGVLPVTILRTTFLALFFGFFWLAAKAWSGDRMVAGLATLSATTIYTFGFYAHHDLTHSTVLATACAAMLWLAARLRDHGRTSDYVLFGIALGLGALGKWNAVMLAAAVFVTGLVVPSLRTRVLDWRLLLSGAVAALLVLPTALWVVAHQEFAVASRTVLVQEDRSALGAVGQLIKALIAFPQPFLALALIVFWSNLRRARANDAARLLGLLILVGIALHAALIPVYGGIDYSERWMIAVLLPLPIVVFALLQGQNLAAGRLRVWLGVLALVALTGLFARVAIQLRGGDDCGKCRTQIPFAELAGQIRDAGFAHGTILADGFHLAGNLRWAFPESRIVEGLGLLDAFGPPRGAGDGACLIAWPEDAGTSMPERLRAFVTGPLGVDLAAPAERGAARALVPGSATRRYGILWELRPGTGTCR